MKVTFPKEGFKMNYSLFVEGWRDGPVGEFEEFNDAWNYVQRIRTARMMPGMDPYIVTIKNNVTQKEQLITSALSKDVILRSIS